MHLWSLVENRFDIKGQCDLYLSPLTLKSGGVIYWPRPMHQWSNKDEALGLSIVIGQKPFWYTRSMWPWYLSLQPQNHSGSSIGQDQSTSEIWGQRAHWLSLLVGNCLDNKGHKDLDLWPLDTKSIGAILWSRAMHLWSLWSKGPIGCWVVLLETILTYKVSMTLTIDPPTPKSIVVIY
jgi:hypothetical protein